jgi:glutamine synthetase
MATLAEYIWIDGTQPSKQLRSKTKVMHDDSVFPPAGSNDLPAVSLFSSWGADGSSTNQATGRDSDIGLQPVAVVRDPIRTKGRNYLVMCEVLNPDGTIHASNTRAELRKVLDAGAAQAEAWFGFEQEYTFLASDGRPLGFPSNGFPGPQGPYYCAVGNGKIFGRAVYEEFLQAAVDAGLAIAGANWEVMPGQAEFQIGAVDGLTAADHVWFARWLLHRIGEAHGIGITIDAKPAKGDWNGAGMHTNFSTREMRGAGGFAAIEEACKRIGLKRQEHLDHYGHGYEERLTGHHETCSYREFRYGVADRTSSIRIPRHVAQNGNGYLEDRRPNANADPYAVAARLLKTVCGLG